jgi:hypothetical protein
MSNPKGIKNPAKRERQALKDSAFTHFMRARNFHW